MIWFMLAAVFVVYFMTVAVYTGMESRFHLIWLLLAALSTFCGVLADQTEKGMIWIPGFLLVVFLIFWIGILLLITRIVIRIVKAGKTETEPGADYMIVLGAHVNGRELSRALQNRLDAAFSYYQTSPDTICLLSGAMGPGEDITEAKAMQEYLVHRGIPEDKLLLEEESYNTEQNIANCRVMTDMDEKKVLVVTNRFHLYRALCICRKQGMKSVMGLAAEDHPIMIPTYYLREVLAILDYKRKKKI